METALNAERVPRYAAYRAVGMKKMDRSKDEWLADELPSWPDE